MKRLLSWLWPMTMAATVATAASNTNAPASLHTNPPPATAVTAAPVPSVEFSTNATEEDLEKMVLKPPTSRAPISTMPTIIDRETPPPLSPEAQKHQYLGYRLGMSVEEATLLAQTAGKKLAEVEKEHKYQMDGCLTDVPEKGKTQLLFKNGKLDLIIIFWEDDNSLFIKLEQSLLKVYGKPLKVDELFRRYWILDNGDCIRMLYDVGAHQTSLVYGSKQAVFDLSEREKLETTTEYKGL